jgi:signal transduction histidine kinase
MSKGGQHSTIRRRVVAIFLVAVMLPSLFLSYVGLKSIKQEKLWQQQLVSQNLRGSLSLAVNRIEASIEDQARTFLSSLPSQQSPLSSDLFHSLNTVLEQQGFIEQVFLLSKDLDLIYPRTFRDEPGTFWKQRAKADFKQNEHLVAGEGHETRGNLAEAIREYQDGISAGIAPQTRLALLARIARCQFKKNDIGSAAETYRRIIQEDKQQFYGEEIPYVVTASYQLVIIAEKLQTPSTVAELILNFYQLLLENFHRLDRGQFEFYLEELRSKISKILAKAGTLEFSRYEKLQGLEQLAADERSRGNLFRMKLLPSIQQEVNLLRPSKKIRYTALNVDGTDWHFGLQSMDESGSPIKILGILFHRPALMSSIQEICHQAKVSEGTWVDLVKDQATQKGEVPRATVVLSTPLGNLADLLPGYVVAIVSSGEDPIKVVASKSLVIYYVLIFSIVAIIILGVVFIFRDISREEELSRMKSEFISNVSHEIKTPIATVRTLAENLNEGWVTDDNKRRDYFRLIARESERLSHLVENILDFSRMDADRKTYRMETVPIGDVVSKTVNRFRLLIDGQGVMVREQIPPDLPKLKVDADALEQALLNLLDNAVKYSGENKYVEVSARIQGQNIFIKVSDRGSGISKSDLRKIFEKFYRVESREGKKVPGSGIGLTLVKEIVEAHEGRVEVESEVGKGSVFTLIIPIKEETASGVS